MNGAATSALETLWEKADKAARQDPDHFVEALGSVALVLRDRLIADTATKIFITHDRGALWRKYNSCWVNGWPDFSFDISDCEHGDQPWMAAWQMAIEEWETGRFNDQIPQATEAEIMEWHSRQQGVQLDLFGQPLTRRQKKKLASPSSDGGRSHETLIREPAA